MQKLGVIGGSGLYEIEGLTDREDIKIETPFGETSDVFMKGKLGDTELYFLPRHGKGHKLLPSEINFRANIFAFKKLGVDKIISISAVGSLKGELKPRDIVIPNQFFDRTQGRKDTFFGDGIVGHVSFGQPICSSLSAIAYEAATKTDADVHKGGTYVNMEGPAFSTMAESNFYRSQGFDIIGMTNLAEAKLSREAEICYTSVCMVTDYDCWKTDEEVTVDMIIANLMHNTANAKEIIKTVASMISQKEECSCGDALSCAIITNPDVIPDNIKEALAPIIGKYVK